VQDFRQSFLHKKTTQKALPYFAVLVRVINRTAEEKPINGSIGGLFGDELLDVFFQLQPLSIPYEAIGLLDFVDEHQDFFHHFSQIV